MIIATALFWSLSLCIAELSSALPFTGGPSVFAHAAFGSLASSIIGYTYFLAFAFGCAQTMMSGCALFRSIVDIPEVYDPLIWLLFLLIFLPFQRTKKLFFNTSLVLTGLASLFLIVVVVMCIPFTFRNYEAYLLSPDPVSIQGRLEGSDGHIRSSFEVPGGDWTGILRALPYACWAYVGIEMISITAEEAHNSEMTAPRSSMYGMTVLTALTWALLLVLPGVFPGSAVLAKSSQPIIDSLFPNLGLEAAGAVSVLTRLLGMLGFFASFHAGTYALSRLMYALSRGGHLPSSLSITEPPLQTSQSPGLRKVGLMFIPKHTPWRSIMFGTVFVYSASLLIWALGKESIAADLFLKANVFVILVSYIGGFLSFIALRMNLPRLPRPFRSPAGIVGAVFGTLVCIFVVIASLVVDYDFRLAALLSSCLMVLIVPYYILFARKRLLVTPEKAFIRKHLNYKFQERISRLPSHSSSSSSFPSPSSATALNVNPFFSPSIPSPLASHRTTVVHFD
jgi:ethanolamine permease